MPELHVEVSGSGTPLVLLHGWGMHGGVFRHLADQLARHHKVLVVDLPGHGESDGFAEFADLPALADYCMQHLSSHLSGPAILIGWSLGGFLAQFLAMHSPEVVSKLVLICSTPCFRRRADWSCAMDDASLSRFAASLDSDTRGTLSRFLALQFMGTPNEKDQLRHARELVFAKPLARRDMLQQGLQLLREQDLRARLADIHCPLLVVSGERDRLVPSSVAPYLSEHVRDGRSIIVRDAGHAPFLTHSAQLRRYLEGFINEH